MGMQKTSGTTGGMRVGEEETDAEVFKGWKGMETVFNEGIREMGKGDTRVNRGVNFPFMVITACPRKGDTRVNRGGGEDFCWGRRIWKVGQN